MCSSVDASITQHLERITPSADAGTILMKRSLLWRPDPQVLLCACFPEGVLQSPREGLEHVLSYGTGCVSSSKCCLAGAPVEPCSCMRCLSFEVPVRPTAVLQGQCVMLVQQPLPWPAASLLCLHGMAVVLFLLAHLSAARSKYDGCLGPVLAPHEV